MCEAHPRDLSHGLGQEVAQVLDRRALVARRIDCVEANQPLEDLDGLLLQLAVADVGG